MGFLGFGFKDLNSDIPVSVFFLCDPGKLTASLKFQCHQLNGPLVSTDRRLHELSNALLQ